MSRKSLQKVVGFNYKLVEEEQQETLRLHSQAIRLLAQRTAMNLVEIGRRLNEVHELVGRKYFKDWIHAECPFSVQSAYAFRKVHDKFGHLDCLDQINISGMMLLARDRTDQRAVDEVIGLAKAGEYVSGETVEHIRRKYEPPPAPRRAVPPPRSADPVEESGEDPVTELKARTWSVARRLGYCFVARILRELADELDATANRATSVPQHHKRVAASAGSV